MSRAIVTGASRGIGRAVAVRLAQRGWVVGINYRTSREAAEETARLVRLAGGTPVLLPADLRDLETTREMFKAFDHSDGLSVLVNNAGVVRDTLLGSRRGHRLVSSARFRCARLLGARRGIARPAESPRGVAAWISTRARAACCRHTEGRTWLL